MIESKLLEDFVKKVMETYETFKLDENEGRNAGRRIVFIQNKFGNVRYIYSIHSYYNKNTFHTSLIQKPTIVAIIVSEKIYIVDTVFFSLYGENLSELKIPENTYFFYDERRKRNEYIENNIFQPFYNDLKPVLITDKNTIYKCHYFAREILLSINLSIPEPCFGVNFTQDEFAMELCGLIDLEEEAKKKILKEKDKWIYQKSFFTQVQKYINEKEDVEEYELQIAESLRETGARTVKVEFTFNEKTDSIKIKSHKLINILICNDYFSEHDFEVHKEGEAFLKQLGASAVGYNKNNLKPKHISKIIYDRKTIYEAK